jgi:hypothetical protein
MTLEETADRDLRDPQVQALQDPALQIGEGQVRLLGHQLQQPARVRLRPPRGRGATAPVWDFNVTQRTAEAALTRKRAAA